MKGGENLEKVGKERQDKVQVLYEVFFCCIKMCHNGCAVRSLPWLPTEHSAVRVFRMPKSCAQLHA